MVEERWRRPGLTGPILLIIIGLVLLLSTLNVLQVNWWELWRLWPLILVLIGLDILSRHSRWASVVVMAATLVLVGIVLFLLVTKPKPLQPYFAGTGALVVHPVHEDLSGARRVQVDIRMGVGELRVSDLDDSAHFFEGQLNYPERQREVPAVSYRVDGDEGRLLLASRNSGGWVFPFMGQPAGESWTVRLSREVPYTFDIDAGASSSVLDLSHLQLEDLRVRSGVGRMDILFPARGKRMSARVSGGVGELVLRIPENVGARIRIGGGLGGQDIDERFRPAGDDTYETSDYGRAVNRLEVRVDGGVGTLRVESVAAE